MWVIGFIFNHFYHSLNHNMLGKTRTDYIKSTL